MTGDQIRDYMTSPEGLMIGFVIGVLGTALVGSLLRKKRENWELNMGRWWDFAR